MSRVHLVGSMFSLAPLLAGCGGGGGGGGGSIEGLSTPTELSIITPVDGSPSPGGTAPGAGIDDFPADADYFEDETRVYVYDRAVEPLQIINEILCLMGQTAASELVNEPPYLAQIDESECAQGSNQDSNSSETGQSSGAQGEGLTLWTVESTRASASAPQIVHVWVPEEEEPDMPATIQVVNTITEGVSDANPFGEFQIDFAGVANEGGSIDDPFFHGTLETIDDSASIGFEMFFSKGDLESVPASGESAEETQASVLIDADQTSGSARILAQQRGDFGMGDSGLLASEFLIAFDDAHMLRSIDGGAAEAFFRDQFTETAWRYNLYYADGENIGERVELNGGFGIRTEAGDYGYAGYYGVWFPDEVTLENGETVVRSVFDEPTEDVPYTIVKGGGKAIRNTRNSIGLSDIVGDLFQWDYYNPESMTFARYQVSHDGSNWTTVAVWNDETFSWDALDVPEVIDTASIGFLSLYSDALGGPASFTHNDDEVIYWTREILTPADAVLQGVASIDLYGYFNCLRSGILGSEADSGFVFLQPQFDVSMPYHYVFDVATLTLMLDVNGDGSELVNVGLAGGEAPTTGPNIWGMVSGALVSDTSGYLDPNEIWGAEVFYTYETGHNSWNVYTGLVDAAGADVVFDPPIQFNYVHTTANDRNGDSTYDGKTYLLFYNGPGDLGGLPYFGIDFDADGSEDRFYPVFSLADGILLGPSGTEYVLKALELEQSLLMDGAYAGSLDLTGASDLVLPDGSSYQAPDIGAAPVITDPPRVIEGVVVGAIL